jgi:hypothetical protein
LMLEVCGPGWARWLSTSARRGWYPLGADGLSEVLAHLTTRTMAGGGARHLLQVRVADDPHVPSYGFDYREVDPRREPRSSHLTLALPGTADPDQLMRLMTTLVESFPIDFAFAGWTAHWLADSPWPAFDAIKPWCRRFLGLEVSMPEPWSWKLDDGMPALGWLTWISEDRIATWSMRGALAAWCADPRLSCVRLARGVLLQAGAAPELGDTNMLEYPLALAALHRTLWPHMAPSVPQFPGAYWGEGEMERWRRRLVEPEQWR